MTALVLEGEGLHPDASGALICPALRTLVVADLHLEKGSFFASKGQMLPPYDTKETLNRLAGVMARCRPVRVIALGDSFHDQNAADRLDDETKDTLRALAARVEWIWIAGNHDPHPPADLGGAVVEEVALGPLTFRHEPWEGEAPGEIAGHLHPCATVHIRGRAIRRRCFISDGRRLVLPAFGAYTGGLSVRAPAIRSLFPRGFNIWLLGDRAVYAMSSDRLGLRGADCV
ncbi:MAG: ligase-associated DNA damage response endonuclease PdeM [Alphaproteobacteria bacterium]|nr:ligase-associated DNA damage response endonuclease PdeM [Alphaproteobacteria bacterium]